MIILADSEEPDQTANVRAKLGLRCPHILEDTVLHGAVYIGLVTLTLTRVFSYNLNNSVFLFSSLFFSGGGGGGGGGEGSGYSPFKNISLISSRSFIEGRRKSENPGTGKKPADHP